MRTVVSYIGANGINNMASASSTGSVEAVTGLSISTGLNVGNFLEYSDDQVKSVQSRTGVNLYSGIYQWVQLDPAVTGTVPLGSALYWLQTATGMVVTTVATANTNNPDFAGVSIDPNFGAALPYAYMQVNGKCSCLFDASVAVTYGAVVNTSATFTSAKFAALASGTLTVTQATVGYRALRVSDSSPSQAPGPFPKTSSLGNAAMPRLGSSAPSRPLGCVPIDRAKRRNTMQTQQTITFFGTVSNSATSRTSKTGRKYTAFGVSIISDRNLQAFHYNVVAFGKQGHFAKQLQAGTRIKLVVQAQSQPDNIATLPLLTATFVRPVTPVAVAPSTGV